MLLVIMHCRVRRVTLLWKRTTEEKEALDRAAEVRRRHQKVAQRSLLVLLLGVKHCASYVHTILVLRCVWCCISCIRKYIMCSWYSCSTFLTSNFASFCTRGLCTKEALKQLLCFKISAVNVLIQLWPKFVGSVSVWFYCGIHSGHLIQ